MADTKKQSTVEKKDTGDIVLTVSIPWERVETVWNQVIDQAVEEAHIQGFRKGKAPRKLVEESLDQAKIREEVLKKLLPEAYIATVNEHNLKPIVNPKIHVEKLETGEPWEFTATTCEMPEIDLGDYKKRVQSVTAKSKILKPGQEGTEAPNFDAIMDKLIEGAKVTIPQMLIDQEVDRLLAQTLDEIKRLGLSLDQYLTSTGKSAEAFRDEYAQKARRDISLELALQKVSETEKLIVEEKEVEEAVQKAKDPQERAYLEGNRYMLANILRQQKTLDYLKNL